MLGDVLLSNDLDLLPFGAKSLSFIKSDLKRFNILEGSIRSSKTLIGVIKFLNTLLLRKDESKQIHNCLLVGASIGSLQRNVLPILSGYLNHYLPSIKYSYNRQFNYILISNYKIFLIGFSNITTSKIILGSTILATYIDEINLAVKDGLETILDRMSYKDSFMIASHNPTSPSHWLYEMFHDNVELKDILNYWHFTLKDNVALDDDYISSLMKRYPVGSAQYKTKILGERASEENSVYGDYIDENTFGVYDDSINGVYCIGVDIGFQSLTVLSLQKIAVEAGVITNIHIYDEVVLDGSKVAITYPMIVDEIVNIVKDINIRLGVPVGVCIPHDGVPLYNELRARKDLLMVIDLIKPERLQSIEHVRKLLWNGILHIDNKCEEHYKSYFSFAWKLDSNKLPIVDKSSNDHACIDGKEEINICENGFYRRISFEKLHEKDLENNYISTPSFNIKTKSIEWKRIIGSFYQGEKEIIDYGGVNCTYDHNFYFKDSEIKIYKKPLNSKISKSLMVLNSFGTPIDYNKKINMFYVLWGFYLGDGIKSRNRASYAGNIIVNKDNKKYFLNKILENIPYKKTIQYYNNIEYHNYIFKWKTVREWDLENIKLNKDNVLSLFCGLMASDDFIRETEFNGKKNIEFSFSNNNIELLKFVELIVNLLGGKCVWDKISYNLNIIIRNEILEDMVLKDDLSFSKSINKKYFNIIGSKQKELRKLDIVSDVYDIEVEDNHNFFIGSNLFLVSNCDSSSLPIVHRTPFKVANYIIDMGKKNNEDEFEGYEVFG